MERELSIGANPIGERARARTQSIRVSCLIHPRAYIYIYTEHHSTHLRTHSTTITQRLNGIYGTGACSAFSIHCRLIIGAFMTAKDEPLQSASDAADGRWFESMIL